MAFLNLEEGVEDLFAQAMRAGRRYHKDPTGVLQTDTRLAAHLRRRARNPFESSDRYRRVTAEIHSRRRGKRVEPVCVERKPCPHCGAPVTHVLSGSKAGFVYHTGKRENIEPPCLPVARVRSESEVTNALGGRAVSTP